MSRLWFVAKAIARVEKADVLEKVRSESAGKQVALDAMAHSLDTATKAGLFWKTKAGESQLMATLLLKMKPSGYIVIPKDLLDAKKFFYKIDVKEREDDVRFKLIETKKPEEKEAVN